MWCVAHGKHSYREIRGGLIELIVFVCGCINLIGTSQSRMELPHKSQVRVQGNKTAIKQHASHAEPSKSSKTITQNFTIHSDRPVLRAEPTAYAYALGRLTCACFPWTVSMSVRITDNIGQQTDG